MYSVLLNIKDGVTLNSEPRKTANPAGLPPIVEKSLPNASNRLALRHGTQVVVPGAGGWLTARPADQAAWSIRGGAEPVDAADDGLAK